MIIVHSILQKVHKSKLFFMKIRHFHLIMRENNGIMEKRNIDLDFERIKYESLRKISELCKNTHRIG